MTCSTLPAAHSLNYQAETPGTPPTAGILRIGEVQVQPEDLAVLLTNTATGRVHLVDNDPAQLPDVVIDMPTNLTPGQVYELRVVAPNRDRGIAPIPFRPYLYTISTGVWSAQAASVEGVHVTFVKMFDGAMVHKAEQQWITLK
jgi:hypothetical protein